MADLALKPVMGNRNPLTRAALARRIRALACDMASVSAQMQHAGGFDADILLHAHELLNASAIAQGWAREIDASAKE